MANLPRVSLVPPGLAESVFENMRNESQVCLLPECEDPRSQRAVLDEYRVLDYLVFLAVASRTNEIKGLVSESHSLAAPESPALDVG